MRSPAQVPVGRRRVLRSVGATSILLAGCLGGGGDRAEPTTDPATEPASTRTTTDPATTGDRSTRTDGGTPPPDPDEAFEFWVGEWAVGGGTVVVHGLFFGTLLFERWREGSGWVGATYFDPSVEQWRRTLTDDGGVLVTLGGTFADGRMTFAGRRVAPDGAVRDLRATFAPRDGTVEHLVEASTDGGEWTVLTDVTATRRGDPPAFPEPTATPSPVAGPDPATLEPRRRFDFWVGEWDVFNASDSKVGTNVVRSVAGGNLLVENWVDNGGTPGKSLNYYDPDTGEWVQRWVHRSGGIIVTRGGFEDGAMRMVGYRIPPGGDERTPFRSTFTPNDDGSVTQLLEESDDGDAWSTAFEGRYVRRSASGE